MKFHITATIGPSLFLDDLDGSRMHLSALFITPTGDAPPPSLGLERDKVTPTRLTGFDHATVWRARFSLPADRTSSYAWNGDTYSVGKSARYIAERNYLVLERGADGWSARWDLEESGMTGPLPL